VPDTGLHVERGIVFEIGIPEQSIAAYELIFTDKPSLEHSRRWELLPTTTHPCLKSVMYDVVLGPEQDASLYRSYCVNVCWLQDRMLEEPEDPGRQAPNGGEVEVVGLPEQSVEEYIL
jgi:hypothetical protein